MQMEDRHSDEYWGRREDWHRQYGANAVRCSWMCEYGPRCSTPIYGAQRAVGLCKRHATPKSKPEPEGEYAATARLADESETIRRGARSRGEGPLSAYVRLLAVVFGRRNVDVRPVDDLTYVARHQDALLTVLLRPLTKPL